MKKVLITLVVLLILFSSAGCEMPGKKAVEEDFNVGTKGLEMKFIENMPPNEIWDDSYFGVAVEVRNMGASRIAEYVDNDGSVEGGWISPRGFSMAYIEGIEPQKFILDSRTKFNPSGGFSIINFEGHTNPLTEVFYDYIEQPILVTVCYIYRTKASPGICMTSETYVEDPSAVACTLHNVDLTSQAAPVAITKIEHNVVPVGEDFVEMYFIIHVKNVGTGKVIKQQLVNKQCVAADQPSYQQLDRIYVEEISLFEDAAFCGHSGGTSTRENCERVDALNPDDPAYANVIILNKEGEGLATYKFGPFKKDALEAPFVTPLNIQLKYGYREHISKTIKINKRAP